MSRTETLIVPLRNDTWSVEVSVCSRDYPADWKEKLKDILRGRGWLRDGWRPDNTVSFQRDGERYSLRFRQGDQVPNWVRLTEHYIPMYLEEIKG